jgi:hypothetical protein
MVSQTCAILLVCAALIIGAVAGVLWSSRRGHGQHAFYGPIFSVAMVRDRIEAESKYRDGADAERQAHYYGKHAT